MDVEWKKKFNSSSKTLFEVVYYIHFYAVECEYLRLIFQILNKLFWIEMMSATYDNR